MPSQTIYQFKHSFLSSSREEKVKARLSPARRAGLGNQVLTHSSPVVVEKQVFELSVDVPWFKADRLHEILSIGPTH